MRIIDVYRRSKAPCGVAHGPVYGTAGLALWIVVAVGFARLMADSPRTPPPRGSVFPSHVFFHDAFVESLRGSRPQFDSQDAKLSEANSVVSTGSSDMQTPSDNSQTWSRVVTADVLEDAVKLLQIQLDKAITTSTAFSSGGHQEVRSLFSELAMLFAVIAEYDATVRWKQDAPGVRDLFVRAAANAKSSSQQAFQEAKQRKEDLTDLVRSGRIVLSGKSDPVVGWNRVVDRVPLMKRLTVRYQENVVTWTSNADTFRDQLAPLRREAELLRLASAVLAHSEMADADDTDYVAFCRQFRDATTSLLQAVQQQDYPAARLATSAIGQACDACHEDYRG